MKFLRPLNLEMDSLNHYTAKVFVQAEGKYYVKELQNHALTTTRNLIIEIMMIAKNRQFKKNMLIKEVMQAMQVNKLEGLTDEKQVQELINNICELKDSSNYKLK